MKDFPGEAPVVVDIVTSEGQRVFQLGSEYRVQPVPDFFAEAKALLGEAASGVKLTGHAAVLLVEDVGRSADYYRDALGFETNRWDVNPEHYGYASRDGRHLHFARFEERVRGRITERGAARHVRRLLLGRRCRGAARWSLAGRGAELLHGPVDQEYGLAGASASAIRTAPAAFGQGRY